MVVQSHLPSSLVRLEVICHKQKVNCLNPGVTNMWGSRCCNYCQRWLLQSPSIFILLKALERSCSSLALSVFSKSEPAQRRLRWYELLRGGKFAQTVCCSSERLFVFYPASSSSVACKLNYRKKYCKVDMTLHNFNIRFLFVSSSAE